MLTGCDTGRGNATLGGDVIGLTRALLRSGVRRAIVSLWPVDDAVAPVLIQALYKRIRAGDAPAVALAVAQQELAAMSADQLRAAYVALGGGEEAASLDEHFARFGDRPVIVVGTLLMAACVAIATLAGHAVLHYGWALGVLGLGWNLLFVAATTMLTKTYRARERIQAQTLNDFLVFGAQAVASLLAGLAVTTLGWEQLNLATLPLLAAVLVAVAALRRRPAAAPA